jgi:hypothetical protein
LHFCLNFYSLSIPLSIQILHWVPLQFFTPLLDWILDELQNVLQFFSVTSTQRISHYILYHLQNNFNFLFKRTCTQTHEELKEASLTFW